MGPCKCLFLNINLGKESTGLLSPGKHPIHIYCITTGLCAFISLLLNVG